MNRRQMLVAMGLMAAGTPLLAAPGSGSSNGKKLPFYNILDFGAISDGKTLNTTFINNAIDACTSAGGGMIYVPPGNYLTGTVILKSNVTLYLEAGATLLGSQNIRDYLPQPQSQKPTQEQSGSSFVNDLRDAGGFHLVFARDAENVGLAGFGTIDGQGSVFWAPNGRTPPKLEDLWRDTIAHGWKPLPPRPSPIVEFYNCTNLHIDR